MFQWYDQLGVSLTFVVLKLLWVNLLVQTTQACFNMPLKTFSFSMIHWIFVHLHIHSSLLYV